MWLVVFCELFQTGGLLPYRLSLLDHLGELPGAVGLWYHTLTAVSWHNAVRYVLPLNALVRSLVWLLDSVGAYCLDVFDGWVRLLRHYWLYQR